jgi:hypothetical protein
MLSRDWQCLNGRCKATFHSYEHTAPSCPKCGCVRVGWTPGGGHVGSMKALDASLNALAKSYGMTDIANSPSRSLNRAMPKHDMVAADGPVINFAPGFAAPFHTGGRATCEPSRTKVDFKVSAAAEKQLTPSGAFGPQIGASNWKTMRKAYRP